MKNRTKLIIILGAAALGTLALGACAHPDTTYSDLAGQGANVIVTYDKNGGQFASRDEIDITDVYSYDDVQAGIGLIAPGDPLRGKDAAGRSTITRAGYQLIGWYLERIPRTDSEERPLDDYGELCSETNRAQGYTYGGKWDFASRELTLDDLEPSEEEWGTAYRVTLYAAWAPNFRYDFYAKDAEGAWQCYGSATRTVGKDLAIPSWNVSTGRLEYNGIPVYNGEDKTWSMKGLYLDEAMQTPLATDNMDHVDSANSSETMDANGNAVRGIPHGGTLDEEHGVGVDIVKKVYTEWREREWFRIYTAKQFSDRIVGDAGFEIMANLDFTVERLDSTTGEPTQDITPWPASVTTFNGVIEGNGYAVRGINVSQDAAALVSGGLFGSITSEAVIRDVKFENLSFIVYGTTRQSGQYGLLAGSISEEATIENVTVTGTLHLGDLVDTQEFVNYTVGLLSGNLETGGIDTSGIDVVVDKTATTDWDDEAEDFVYAWKFKATVDEESTRVTITRNDDLQSDPNLPKQ